jgi:hypothetical protein
MPVSVSKRTAQDKPWQAKPHVWLPGFLSLQSPDFFPEFRLIILFQFSEDETLNAFAVGLELFTTP